MIPRLHKLWGFTAGLWSTHHLGSRAHIQVIWVVWVTTHINWIWARDPSSYTLNNQMPINVIDLPSGFQTFWGAYLFLKLCTRQVLPVHFGAKCDFINKSIFVCVVMSRFKMSCNLRTVPPGRIPQIFPTSPGKPGIAWGAKLLSWATASLTCRRFLHNKIMFKQKNRILIFNKSTLAWETEDLRLNPLKVFGKYTSLPINIQTYR